MLIKIKELKIEEQEFIINELAKGEISKTIAPKLNLSLRTIESKIETMKKQYNALNIAHLLGIYYKDKLNNYE